MKTLLPPGILSFHLHITGGLFSVDQLIMVLLSRESRMAILTGERNPSDFLGILANTLVPKLSTLELPFFVSWMFLALQWASV